MEQLPGSPTPAELHGYWSKLNHQGTTGFSPCPFASLPFFGYLFLTHSHVGWLEGKAKGENTHTHTHTHRKSSNMRLPFFGALPKVFT